MASVKVKFRPSTLDGKEGTLYYQVIHNRVVRQIYTDYKLFASEWDCRSEAIVLHRVPNEQERNNYLLSISSRIRWNKDRVNKIIHTLSQSGTFVTDDIVARFQDNKQEQSFNDYLRIIAKTKSTSVFDRISRTNLEISTKLRVKTRVQKSTFAPWFFGMCLDKTIVLCYYGVLLTYTNLLPINN